MCTESETRDTQRRSQGNLNGETVISFSLPLLSETIEQETQNGSNKIKIYQNISKWFYQQLGSFSISCCTSETALKCIVFSAGSIFGGMSLNCKASNFSCNSRSFVLIRLASKIVTSMLNSEDIWDTNQHGHQWFLAPLISNMALVDSIIQRLGSSSIKGVWSSKRRSGKIVSMKDPIGTGLRFSAGAWTITPRVLPYRSAKSCASSTSRWTPLIETLFP